MKKIKIFSIILFLFSAAVYAGCRVYDGAVTDHTPPVIAGEGMIQASVADPGEKLLEGMSAEDDRDGDVTESLVVQSISGFDEEGRRTVNYAAADGSGNVGYYSRQLEYTDYRTPVFSLSAPLRFPVGTSFNICSGISAESSLDGNLSDNIKYTLDRTVLSSAPGTYQIEFRVTDSAEKTSYLQTELEVYDPGEEQLEVTLTAYLVYLNVNDSFHASDYFQESETGGEPEIESNVDTSKAGTYYVDYTVTEDGFTGKSRLIVVVR